MSNEIKKYIKKIDFTNFFITYNVLELIENRKNLEFFLKTYQYRYRNL